MAGDRREILFEFIRRGAFVKVTALDPVTGTEASIVGPPSAGAAALKALAVRKLDYVLNKNKPRPR